MESFNQPSCSLTLLNLAHVAKSTSSVEQVISLIGVAVAFLWLTTELNSRLLSTISTAILVLLSSKRRVRAPTHARRCVIEAISRIPPNEKAGLSWVLMYALFLLLSFLIADFLPQDGLPLEAKRGSAPLYP